MSINLKHMIESSFVDAESVVNAFLEQEMRIPSLLKYLKSVKKISDFEIVEYLNLALERGVTLSDFISDMDEDLFVEYKNYISNIDCGLFKILIEKNKVSKTDLEKYLLEIANFKKNEQEEVHKEEHEEVREELSDKDGIGSEDDDSGISAAALESLRELNGGVITDEDLLALQTNNSIEVEKVADEDETSEISDAALESLRELGIDTSHLEQESKKDVTQNMFVETQEKDSKSDEKIATGSSTSNEVSSSENKYFQDKKFKKISKILKMISEAISTNQDVGNYYNSLYREIHEVDCDFSRLQLRYFYRLINLWVNVLDRVVLMSLSDSLKWSSSNFNALNEAVNYIYQSTLELGENTEESYFKVAAKKELYLKNINNLKSIMSII